MLRITASETPKLVTLKLEGRLATDWVAELRNECRRRLSGGRRVRLDFQNVTFVDRAGALMLRELASEQVRIVNCPPLVRESLEAMCPEWQ